ncbi:MAG: hypothetical protein ACYC2H_00025 [Thermoplasmatota archaeon]
MTTEKRRRNGFLLLAIVLALAGSTAGAAAALYRNHAVSVEDLNEEPQWMATEDGARQGDRLTFSVTAFTAEGVPVGTSSYSVAVALNTTTGFRLEDDSYYQSGKVTLGSGDVDLLGPTFEKAMYGHKAGDRYQTDLISANDTITGADGAITRLPRWSPEFPLTETVPAAAFLQRFPNATLESIVQLNPRFYAQVDQLDAVSVTYHFLVKDGLSVPLCALGEAARLTTVVEGDHFRDRIDIEPGTGFFRKNDRVLNITHGHYIVLEVTEDEIIMQMLKGPFYEFAMQDVYFVVEISQVERLVEDQA